MKPPQFSWKIGQNSPKSTAEVTVLQRTIIICLLTNSQLLERVTRAVLVNQCNRILRSTKSLSNDQQKQLILDKIDDPCPNCRSFDQKLNNGSPALKSWLISHSLWRFERNLRTDGDQDQRLEQIELLPKNHASPSKKCVNLSKNSFKRNKKEKWNWSHP